MNKIDTNKAYQILWEKIASLSLAPGEILDIAALGDEIGYFYISPQKGIFQIRTNLLLKQCVMQPTKK